MELQGKSDAIYKLRNQEQLNRCMSQEPDLAEFPVLKQDQYNKSSK